MGEKEPEVISLISENFHIERISLSKRCPDGKELGGPLFVYNTNMDSTSIMIMNHNGVYYGNYVTLPSKAEPTEVLEDVHSLDEKTLQINYRINNQVLPCKLIKF